MSESTREGYVIAPLDWEDPCRSNNRCWVARTVIGTYSVAHEDGWYACLEDGPVSWEWEPDLNPRCYAGPYAAQLACKEHYESILMGALNPLRPAFEDTPAAEWRKQGKADPHGNRYDCARSDLPFGDLTDDELANELFLAPSPGNIAMQTAAKERIRWLSRQLSKSNTGIATP